MSKKKKKHTEETINRKQCTAQSASLTDLFGVLVFYPSLIKGESLKQTDSLHLHLWGCFKGRRGEQRIFMT